MQGLGSAQNGCQRLDGGANDVVVGLLRRQGAPGCLGMESEHAGSRVPTVESLLHYPVPDLASRSILGDFFEEIVVGIEKEGEPGSEIVDLQSGPNGRLDVLDAVAQGEGQFLQGRGTGFSDVIATDRDAVPLGDVSGCEGNGVGNQPHGRMRRIDPLLLSNVFLQDVVLKGAPQPGPAKAAFLGVSQKHGPDDGSRAIDGHGGADGLQVDVPEENLHVRQGIHGDAAFADLAQSRRVIRVQPHESGQVESDRKAGLSLLEQVEKALVGVLGCTEAAELAHGPEAAAIHAGVNSPGIGGFSGESHLLSGVEVFQVLGAVEILDGVARDAGELRQPRGKPFPGGSEGLLFPAAPRLFEPGLSGGCPAHDVAPFA